MKRPKPIASRYDVWTGDDVDGDGPPDPASPEYLDWLTRDDEIPDPPRGRIGVATIGDEPDRWYPMASINVSAIVDPEPAAPGSRQSPLESVTAIVRYHVDIDHRRGRQLKPPFKIEFSDGRELWVNEFTVTYEDE